MIRYWSGYSVAVLLVGFLFSGLLFAKVENDTIVLGAAVSLTGKYSTNGKHTKNGYDLGVEIINKAGGVLVNGKKYKIAIKYYDDESTPARGAQLAERLIKQDKIKFILGPYSSGLTQAMARITEKYKVPMVEANGASLQLFNKGYRYLFAILSTADQYLLSSLVLAQKKLGQDRVLRVAGAFENDPFSQDIGNGILAYAKANKNIKMLIHDKLPPDLNDMSATLTKVKVLKPDLLVVSGHAKGAALAVRQVAERNIKVPFFAMTHCDSADIIGKFKQKAEGVLCASQWDRRADYKDKYFGSAEDFAKRFEKTYGYAPPYQAAESAAAVLVYKSAFERAGSFETSAVRDALAKTDMETFYGKIGFDKVGRNIKKPMVLFQVQNGKYVVVTEKNVRLRTK